MIKGLHHVGFEVKDLEDSIKYYESLGFSVVKRFEYEAAGFKAAMMKGKQLGGVELFQLNDPEHELARKVRRHIAFETDNLDTDLQKFLDEGYKLSIPITEGRVVKRYAYVQDKFNNFIELLEQ